MGWLVPTNLSWRAIGQSIVNPSKPSCQFDYENQRFCTPISDCGNTVKLHLRFWSDMVLDYEKDTVAPLVVDFRSGEHHATNTFSLNFSILQWCRASSIFLACPKDSRVARHDWNLNTLRLSSRRHLDYYPFPVLSVF